MPVSYLFKHSVNALPVLITKILSDKGGALRPKMCVVLSDKAWMFGNFIQALNDVL